MLDRLRRPIESHSKVWLGTIALVAIALIAVSVVGLGRLPLGKTQYRAEFGQAASIRVGDQVTIAGIHVGSVDGLHLAGDRVVVAFTISNDVHVGSDTRAAIKLTTILGSRYVELSPTTNGSLRDRTIPLANTSVPYDLQRTLADATTTFEQVDADRVAESMATLSQSLAGVPDALPEALDNLKSLSGVISGQRDQIGSLLASADTVTSMIRDQQAALGSLVVQGRNLLDQIVSRRVAVQQLFVSATVLVDRIRTILGDEPHITELLAAMEGVSRMLGEHDALLRNILQILPVPVRNLANATGSGAGVDLNAPAGIMVDSWMCAISGRAEQFQLPEYFNDCQPGTDPWPGWPAP